MVYFIIVLVIVLLDQISKLAAIKYLKGNRPLVLIEDFFQLYYVENTGAAFGIFKNGRYFFIIVSILVIVFVVLFIIKYFHSLTLTMKIALSVFIGGAIGNLIDRIRLGYVVDFLSFKLPWGYDFPVFNIADTFIVISTIIIMSMLLFNKYEN
ncbi:MAG: signal peptidase II [Tissierellia bacterium]|nr:signal peptidase II [Tissierellia bacterium]